MRCSSHLKELNKFKAQKKDRKLSFISDKFRNYLQSKPTIRSFR